MKPLKSIASKMSGKQNRERKVLFGLIEYYIKTGKPVGSNTLKESGFENLSSATIRNYFANLEKEGYLSQQHSSGGRIPTNLAYRVYANEYAELIELCDDDELNALRHDESREIVAYLQRSIETLSRLSNCAVFLLAPRFDQDTMIDIRLVSIDHQRCLCVIVTDFGIIRTEVIHLEKKLSAFSTKRLEAYFHWRLTGHDKPENLTREEDLLALKLYNEIMLRYIVGYSNYTDEDVYRTGFSKLLHHSDHHNVEALANSLALFENANSMRLLLKECIQANQLKVWIGEDLIRYSPSALNTAMITVPYYINLQCVGAIGVMGPVRIPYRKLFSLLRKYSECISEGLTRSVYKYKISFRQPEPGALDVHIDNSRLLGHTQCRLLENKNF